MNHHRINLASTYLLFIRKWSNFLNLYKVSGRNVGLSNSSVHAFARCSIVAAVDEEWDVIEREGDVEEGVLKYKD